MQSTSVLLIFLKHKWVFSSLFSQFGAFQVGGIFTVYESHMTGKSYLVIGGQEIIGQAFSSQ